MNSPCDNAGRDQICPAPVLPSPSFLGHDSTLEASPPTTRSKFVPSYVTAMTKDWESVQEEICRCYSAGDSLTRIQERLNRESGFKASYDTNFLQLTEHRADKSDSIRAYRMKIDEWGLKKRECPQKAAGSRSVLPVASSSQPPSGDSVCNGAALRQLLNTRTQACIPACATILESDFYDGKANILHNAFGLATVDPSLIDWIIRIMKGREISLDLRDEVGRSALELAITANSISHVRTLLNQGAAVGEPNPINGLTPMQLALLRGASPKILLILRERNAQLLDIPMGICETYSPLTVALNKLKQSLLCGDAQPLVWLEIIALLLQWREPGETEKTSVLALVAHCWVRYCSKQLYDVARPLLLTLDKETEIYLYKPLFLEVLVFSTMPLSCQCRTLMDVALWHSPDNRLALFLITEISSAVCSEEDYKLVLLNLFDESSLCEQAYSPQPDHTEIVRTLVNNTKTWQLVEMSCVINKMKDAPKSHKLQYVKAILEATFHDGDRGSTHFFHMMSCLAMPPLEDDLYDLIDSVLASSIVQHYAVLHEEVKVLLEFATFAVETCELKTLVHRLSLYEWPEHLRIFTFEEWELMSHNLVCVLLHIVTRDMLRGLSSDDPERGRKLRCLLEARKSHNLRDLAVPQDLLLGLLSQPSLSTQTDA